MVAPRLGLDHAFVRAPADAVVDPLGEGVLVGRGPPAVHLEPGVGVGDGGIDRELHRPIMPRADTVWAAIGICRLVARRRWPLTAISSCRVLAAGDTTALPVPPSTGTLGRCPLSMYRAFGDTSAPLTRPYPSDVARGRSERHGIGGRLAAH